MFWSTPVRTHAGGTEEDFWGPFSLIYDEETTRFLIASRRRLLTNSNWRIVVSSSSDGTTWTPFEHVTDPSPNEVYWEKGSIIFPIYGPRGTDNYAVIFKRSLPGASESAWQLRQVHLDFTPSYPPLLDRLRGQRINLITGTGTTFRTGDTTHIVHGWTSQPGSGLPYPPWSEMTGPQKREFLSTASFELYILGDPIPLQRHQWYDREADVMWVIYWTEFEPDTFAPVSLIYDFRGVWSIEFDDTLHSFEIIQGITVTL
jgi:hypothetical protein